MLLYIVRHGPAGNAAEWDGPDSERPLTRKGVEMMTRVAARLSDLGIAPAAVVTSPYVRARQTAEIIAGALGRADLLEEDARLAPGFGLAELMSLLTDYSAVRSLVLVGHEPDLGHVICDLTGTRRVSMKKGAAAAIELATPSQDDGQLLWIAPPKVIAP